MLRNRLCKLSTVHHFIHSSLSQKTYAMIPWGRKIIWRRAWQPTPVFLPGESHGQRSLAGHSPRGHRGSDMSEVTEHTHRVSYTQNTDLLGAVSVNPIIKTQTKRFEH